MPDDSIPQAKSLAKIRQFIEEAARTRSLEAAGALLGLTQRHIGYHAAAAETLRLANRRDGSLHVTALGRRLSATEPGSREEAKIWRTAIEQSASVGLLASLVLGSRSPSSEEVERRLVAAGLAASTARHRAGTLMRWRHDVLQQETQGQLGLHPGGSGSMDMRYRGRAMLRSLRIESFKAFSTTKGRKGATSTPIRFAPLTVFVGPNGAGKTTVLQALDILGSLVRMNISEMLEAHGWEYADLPHLRSKTPSISLQVEIELGAAVVEWTLTLGTRLHPGIAGELVRTRGLDDAIWLTLLERKGRQITVTRESTGERLVTPLLTLPQSWLATLDATAREDAASFPGLLALKSWAERIHAFWSLSPATLRSPSRGATERVGPRGDDLASFLFRLKKNRPKRFDAFVKRVAHHYPRLVQIVPRSGQYGWKYLDITERWNGEKATFNARQVSDGLLRLMAVASVPEWDTPPSIVLLDEVENGLHPRLIGGIAALLDEVSATTQVAVTTHSPITLNYVPAESTRLVTRGRGGAVTVTPLDETKNYSKLREHFQPGELWYNAGEERLVRSGR